MHVIRFADAGHAGIQHIVWETQNKGRRAAFIRLQSPLRLPYQLPRQLEFTIESDGGVPQLRRSSDVPERRRPTAGDHRYQRMATLAPCDACAHACQNVATHC